MAKPNLSNREPLIVETASAVAWLTSYRSDLTNSITVTHTSANLLTFSCSNSPLTARVALVMSTVA